MRPLLKWVCVGLIAVTVSQGRAAAIPEVEPLVQSNAAFAMQLYARLSGTQGNIVFSPYSVSSAMAMTYAGARGETARQIERALHFPRSATNVHGLFGRLDAALVSAQANGGVELEIANSLWLQKDEEFRANFLDLVKTDYRATVTPLDFIREHEQARANINRWVDEKTRHKIRDMVAPGDMDELTRMVVADAVYFKGFWATPFPESSTRPGTFIVNLNLSVTTPFMTVSGDFEYFQNDFLECLILPYREHQFEMVLLLPHAGGSWEASFREDQGEHQQASREKQTLAGLERMLNPTDFKAWLSAVQNQRVEVTIPRFKMSCGYALNSVLKALGVTDAFDLYRADFSGIDRKPQGLFLGKLLHQACIEVDEKGTEAAAGASVEFRTWALHPVFFADHPFLFLIRERGTGTILFMGRVADPESKSQPRLVGDSNLNNRSNWIDWPRGRGGF